MDGTVRAGMTLIDDGYQLHMGDWFSAGSAFEGGVRKLCLSIKEQGFEPAIWAAPFIAEEKSEVFRTHPDWFVKDEDGRPLSSAKVSFGGWRCSPWYMLDATNPEVRQHLTNVFRTMRQEWKVSYFKLDANMWGAMPFGERFDKKRTCIESYRMGMKAILDGAGRDSFLLGCNAPMWPSLGVVHGMRVTNDNARDFSTFANIAEECFARNWQHNRLWINDPDTVVLRNRDITVMDPSGGSAAADSSLTRREFLYNATYILASGGMVLSGDDLTEFTAQNRRDLQKLLSAQGTPAVFDTDDNSVGRIHLTDKQIICIFNKEEYTCDFSVRVESSAEIVDFWSEEEIGIWNSGIHMVRLEGHSARALLIIPRQ